MAENGASLELRLSPVEGATYGKNSIPLRVVFENTGADAITLLRHFEPLPVFFAFQMTREDGTPLSISGMGKIDFLEGTVPYLVLNGYELFGIRVDLAMILPEPEEITAGSYTIAVTYHNQYGEGCFQGKRTSNTIRVQL